VCQFLLTGRSKKIGNKVRRRQPGEACWLNYDLGGKTKGQRTWLRGLTFTGEKRGIKNDPQNNPKSRKKQKKPQCVNQGTTLGLKESQGRKVQEPAPPRSIMVVQKVRKKNTHGWVPTKNQGNGKMFSSRLGPQGKKAPKGVQWWGREEMGLWQGGGGGRVWAGARGGRRGGRVG